MSSGDTRALIARAVERLEDEVPAFRKLKLVIRLELRARGDAPIWRVEVPGPKISKDPAGDARLDVSVPARTSTSWPRTAALPIGWTPTSAARSR
jgi:hypothetical protein